MLTCEEVLDGSVAKMILLAKSADPDICTGMRQKQSEESGDYQHLSDFASSIKDG